MTPSANDRINTQVEALLQSYRENAAVLLLLTQRATTTLAKDPPSPTKDQILVSAAAIQKQQIALLTAIDQLVALVSAYTVP